MRQLFLLVATITLAACGSKECCVTPVFDHCYSFYQRQCNTDAFDPLIADLTSETDKENRLKEWLFEQGVETGELTLVYHNNANCEACHICPTDMEIRFSTNSEITESTKEKLDLLNLEKVDCE